MQRFDIAIIGTGPAGLSAALTARARNKSVLLLGSAELSPKLVKAKAIDNYLGFPSVSGADLAAAFRTHLDAAGVPIVEDRVSAIYDLGGYFGIQGSPDIYEADAVVLACGVTSAKPLPGEDELLGSGVSHCATCDAMLYRGRDVVVVGYSPREESEAEFLAEVAGSVRYIPAYRGEPALSENVEVVRAVPTGVEARGNGFALLTETGEVLGDGVFILRESIPPAQLVPGIEVDGARVVVDRRMRTSIAGVFAAGDIVGEPYQYIKSAGEGNNAALAAVAYLDERRRSAD